MCGERFVFLWMGNLIERKIKPSHTIKSSINGVIRRIMSITLQRQTWGSSQEGLGTPLKKVLNRSENTAQNF